MAMGRAISFWPEIVNTIVHNTAARVTWDLLNQRFCLITPTDVTPPVVPVEVARNVLGGKAPVLRPDYDHLAAMRMGETGDTMRIIRSIRRSGEEATRQERELEEATC